MNTRSKNPELVEPNQVLSSIATLKGQYQKTKTEQEADP